MTFTFLSQKSKQKTNDFINTNRADKTKRPNDTFQATNNNDNHNMIFECTPVGYAERYTLVNAVECM